MCARDTFPSRYDRISRFDDGESKLPQMETEDERIERSKWVGLRGYEQSRKIVADSADLGAADI